MPIPSVRRRPALALFLVLAAALSASIQSGVAAQAQTPTATVSATPSTAHPFSDPLWMPLRVPTRVSCTFGNSGCPGYHPYWAIDFLGTQGEPIYAAGAGIFHIGSTDTGCRASTEEAAGTWVWIDHGGGVVSKYTHLNSVTAVEGQLVTPSTVIGEMGHSGDVLPCTTNYLHFEVRTGGIFGPRVDPGQLYGCQGTTRRAYPQAWGYASWKDIPKVSVWTPALDDGCLPASAATTSAPAAIAAARGNETVRVAWTKPTTGSSAVDRYVISAELWGPSINAWHPPTYRVVPANQFATNYRNLDNGRTYRFRVLAHSAVGNSAWTTFRSAVPAAAPLAPGTDRQLSSGTAYVRFGWWNGTTRGEPITSYIAAIRRQTATGWTAWYFVKTPADVRTYRWDGLRSGATYQVNVRANSRAGLSPWGTIRTVKTPRR
jgi:hypothetical protein